MRVLNVNRLVIASSVLVAVAFGSQCFAEDNSSDTAMHKNHMSTKAMHMKPQTLCPVYGGEIDKSLYADVNGKRIYVCCGACIAEVKKDPDKYIKKLESMGQGVEDTPKDTKPAGSSSEKTNSMDHSKMDHSKMKH